MQHEYGVTAFQRLGAGNPAALLVFALVPNDRAVPVRRQRPLGHVGIKVVIGDLDRQALDRRVKRWSAWHRPRAHHTVDLESQVVVVRAGLMFGDDEPSGADAADRKLLVALDLDALDLDLGCPAASWITATTASTASGGPSR